MRLKLDLISGAFWDGGPNGPPIEVIGLAGREAVGDLYTMGLMLRRSPALCTAEIDAVLSEPCALRFEQQAAAQGPETEAPSGPPPETFIHGILSVLERVDAAAQIGASYYAELVPRAWLLTRNRCSRAFMDTTVAEIIKTVFSDHGFVEDEDYVLRLSDAPRHLEYVVQFEESDWCFIQRWLEHEGLSCWFEQGSEGELLVIADRASAAQSHDSPIVVQYRDAMLDGQAAQDQEIITHWNRRHRRTSRRVALIDYDAGLRQTVFDVASPSERPPSVAAAWRMTKSNVPPTDLGAGALSFGAFGSDVQLASYTCTKRPDGGAATGDALARIRAEAIACERVTYAATSRSRRLHAGTEFVLRGDTGGMGQSDYHTEEDDDQEYFVTAVRHRYGIEVGTRVTEARARDEHYAIELEAVRASLPYRPQCVTPWPRIDGLLSAHVMGNAGGAEDAKQAFPTIDIYGRYKVRLPFAVNGSGKVWAWVRMVESMAGQSYGVHLPLHPGVEVLLAHIGGNPDRPVIVGAVPNGSMPTPVGLHGADKGRIRSAGDVLIELDDNSPATTTGKVT